MHVSINDTMTTFKPSLLVSNIFDPISKDETQIMKLYQDIASLDYYKGIETRIILDSDVQKEFAELSKKANWDVTFWLTGNLNSQKMRLCDTDTQARQNAVSYVNTLIDIAAHCNAYAVGFCSGTSTGDREQEYHAFYSSIVEILDYMKKYPDIKLILEPLDAYADKKNVIGDLNTTLRLYEELSINGINANQQFIACIDTAHFALNNDDLNETVTKLARYSDRIHFANAILDVNHPLYGDKHIEIGEHGFLNEIVAQNLVNHARSLKFDCDSIYLTVEVRTYAKADMWPMEAMTREFLNNAMK